MKKILFVTMLALLCISCDKQRDLYDTASPLLYVEGDWMPSLNIADMSQNATAMVYGNGKIIKEYFYKPNAVTTRISKGTYDVFLFNGMMFSEDNTNLDNIYFRGTDNIETFEAFVTEGAANKRLVRSEGEIIASNDMEILTSRRTTKEIEGESEYFLKYKDGENGFPNMADYVEDEVKMTPKPVSYKAQVVVNLINPSSAFAANGALTGFAGSVKLASRMPSHIEVTHHLRLNNMRITHKGTPGNPQDPELGTIESPVFVTFGPPVDAPNRKYEFKLTIVLKDGSNVSDVFDLTEQILPVIEIIKTNIDETEDIPIKLTIPINISMELPEVDPDTGSSIDIGDWEDDEIIRVPINVN